MPDETANWRDKELVAALAEVVGDSRWEVAAIARGIASLLEDGDKDRAARAIYSSSGGAVTLKKSRKLIEDYRDEGFRNLLPLREKTGSAENPITKLFPATITEQRFIESLDDLSSRRAGLSYTDDREVGHTLKDFTLCEGELSLPVNVKTAGTPFRLAADLVGLAPEDCLPIPAYKAYSAVESLPNLLYVISADYDLIEKLNILLPKLLDTGETIVWFLLSVYAGARVRSAEDSFIFGVVRKYWEQFRAIAADSPFHVISARRAIRILQTEPRRTPGIGLRAWGTGANAEVNVHVSISAETTPWQLVGDRIAENGIQDVISAVNRKRSEIVYDPEI